MAEWRAGDGLPYYSTCSAAEECAAISSSGVAAIRPHPTQFGDGWRCIPTKNLNLCDDRRLYVHAVCAVGAHAKARAFRDVGLWLIEVVKMPDDVRVHKGGNGALPCVAATAWREPYNVTIPASDGGAKQGGGSV